MSHKPSLLTLALLAAGAYAPGAAAGIAPRVTAQPLAGPAARGLAEAAGPALSLEQRLLVVAAEPGVLPPDAAAQPPAALYAFFYAESCLVVVA